ncbi:MAG: FAD-dependent oxidoreductase [Chloroflexota bacterium]
MRDSSLPVVVIGAGPVGLAATAHLIERGETPLVIEAGESIGQSVLNWGHVRMFSPWEYTVDSAMVRLLEKSGWEMPPLKALPTGKDLVERFLRPFANLEIVAPYIRTSIRVTAISRQNVDKMKDRNRDEAPFIVQIECADGSQDLLKARAIIDASGTYHNPNPLGTHGLNAIGEDTHSDHIFYGIPDILDTHQERYQNQRVLVVGSGHSAINAVLELGELQQSAPDTQIIWAMRGTHLKKVYGGETNDALPARGALGTRVRNLVEAGVVEIVSPFYLTHIETSDDGLCVTSSENGMSVTVDELIATTGARPNLEMLRELRLNLDSSLETTPILAPMIDPNIHSCGTVRPHGEAELRHPESNFYMIGMKSYGRAPSFLLATGYEQARSVVAYLVGDYEAAKEVQLNLPETGVCSTDFADDELSGGCCSTPASETVAVGNISIGEIPVSVGTIPVVKNGNDSSCCG